MVEDSAVTDLESKTSSFEKVTLTDAAIMEVITHYCGHEAGVRNLKKCLDRVFRKVTAKLDANPTDIIDIES